MTMPNKSILMVLAGFAIAVIYLAVVVGNLLLFTLHSSGVEGNIPGWQKVGDINGNMYYWLLASIVLSLVFAPLLTSIFKSGPAFDSRVSSGLGKFLAFVVAVIYVSTFCICMLALASGATGTSWPLISKHIVSHDVILLATGSFLLVHLWVGYLLKQPHHLAQKILATWLTGEAAALTVIIAILVGFGIFVFNSLPNFASPAHWVMLAMGLAYILLNRKAARILALNDLAAQKQAVEKQERVQKQAVEKQERVQKLQIFRSRETSSLLAENNKTGAIKYPDQLDRTWSNIKKLSWHMLAKTGTERLGVLHSNAPLLTPLVQWSAASGSITGNASLNDQISELARQALIYNLATGNNMSGLIGFFKNCVTNDLEDAGLKDCKITIIKGGDFRDPTGGIWPLGDHALGEITTDALTSSFELELYAPVRLIAPLITRPGELPFVSVLWSNLRIR